MDAVDRVPLGTGFKQLKGRRVKVNKSRIRFGRSSSRQNRELTQHFCRQLDANGLVEERLAACVNTISGVKSFYRWQGKIEADTEVQLLIKTRRGRFEELAAWIAANHPYDVPEIVAVAAEHVSESYLAWAVEQTR